MFLYSLQRYLIQKQYHAPGDILLAASLVRYNITLTKKYRKLETLIIITFKLFDS
jgi:hypothetical protein